MQKRGHFLSSPFILLQYRLKMVEIVDRNMSYMCGRYVLLEWLRCCVGRVNYEAVNITLAHMLLLHWLLKLGHIQQSNNIYCTLTLTCHSSVQHVAAYTVDHSARCPVTRSHQLGTFH